MGQPLAADASPTRVRFGVLGFACSLSLLTYLDRICIMRVQESIRTDLGLSQFQMGLVFSAFLVGYTLFEVPGGWMGDVWGARRVITRIVLWWSLFTALTGCVWYFTLDSGFELALFGLQVPLLLNSLMVLLLVRFLFGCGEAGAYPNLARVVGAWFPFHERALAQGTIWMSARLGGALAPLLIGRLAEGLGWRQAFWVFGAVGVVWGAAFYGWFRDTPEQHPACNDAERALFRAGPHAWQPDQAATAHPRPPWGQLLRRPTLWALCVAGFGVSFAWYFYATWQPQYLKDVHGIGFGQSEVLTGLPFLFGAAGALLGGRLSDRLVVRTGSRRWGRSLIGLGGFGGAALCFLCAGLVPRAWQAVTLLSLATFVNDMAIPVIWAVASDVGGRYAGTVAGIMNTAGGIGAILSPVLTPVILQSFPDGVAVHVKWAALFAIFAGVWFAAALAWLFIDAGRPLVPE